jgi:hypothetical protein
LAWVMRLSPGGTRSRSRLSPPCSAARGRRR